MAATSGESLLGDFSEYFAIFGAIAASYIAVKFLSSLWDGLKAFILARPLGLCANLKKMGSWAVVTGATDGIGKAYAHELAKLGLNIVLVSRSPEKLQDVATEIESKYSVQTKCVAVDFTGGLEIYDTIRRGIAGLDVGVLVNNVGMSYVHPEYYGEVDQQRVRDVINVNITSVTEMTKMILPGMVERKKGAIINVSSSSALRPTPMLTVYSATKSFADCFSQALQTEYKSKGIIVQSVMPYFVATKMSRIRKASFFTPNPVSYVQAALGTVGLQRRTFGCISHALQASVATLMPYCAYELVTMALFVRVRNATLEKLKKK